MSSDNKDIQTIRFRFKTGGYPPPYSHRYNIDVDLSAREPDVRIDLEYTDREELTKEEIYEEGFNEDDDFRWSGAFPEIWHQVISQKVRKETVTKKRSSSGDNRHELRLDTTLSDGSKNGGYIPDTGLWERFLQEIVQAGMELSGRESPLIIRYLSISGNLSIEKKVTLAFAERKVQIDTVSEEKTETNHTIDWLEGTELIKTVYALDYDTDKSSQKKPTTRGLYIDIGESTWYDLQKNVHNPTSRVDLVALLIEKLERL